jgi:oleate hydratase
MLIECYRTGRNTPIVMSSSHIRPSTDCLSPNRLDTWVLGCGISSLASAVSLLQEAQVPPEHIPILQSQGMVGGGTASAGDLANGYHYCAGRTPLLNAVFMVELLSMIPSFNSMSSEDDLSRHEGIQ